MSALGSQRSLSLARRRVVPVVVGVAAVVFGVGAGREVGVPAPSARAVEHKIMTGDRLRITVAEQPELDRVYAVAGDGTIDFPLIGRVRIAEMTTGEAADLIESMLEASFFKEATVNIEVAEFVEGAILVMGAVRNPGTIPFKGDQILTLVEAISMCGGLTPEAAGTEVRILRWQPGGGMERQVLTVDVQSMMEQLDFSRDQFLRPRDIVLVPTLGEAAGRQEFLALGEVGSPGFHPYTEGLDVLRAISRVGGVTREAQLDAVRVLRADGKGHYTPIPVDLSRLLGAADMSMNVPLLPGDILFVPSSQHATRGQVYLLGEVARRGAVPLPLNQEVTLARTILSAGGFTEFANESRVKVLRTAPDGSKQTLVVNVGKILKTGSFEEDLPLENGDVIIVPERVLGF